MRIAILTSGRFHVLDLARELATRGHDVRFYSLLPPQRTRQFGLSDTCNRWLGAWVAPLYGATLAARGTRFSRPAEHALRVALDEVASRLIEPCDVFIGMSGMSLRTVEALRRRGTRTLVERGSRHILSQRAILEGLSTGRDFLKAPIVPAEVVHQELAEYALADTVVVPSRQVAQSFADEGVDPRRLFRNPYGVSLITFPPTPTPRSGVRTAIMVGAFSRRKGCDVLIDAVRGMRDVRLLHVGAPGDCPFPRDSWFETVGAVPQNEILRFYRRAGVAVLASREEGLAMVQAQALACGLPLVCTERTGGEDLRPFVRDRRDLVVVPPDNVAALRDALECSFERVAMDARAVRECIADDQREALSWRGYGARYDAFLTRGERPDALVL